MIQARLEVDGAELIEAARFLRKMARASAGSELLLSYADATLVLEILGTTYSVPASGTWPGVCRVAKRFVGLLAKIPKGRVSLTVMETGHLHVENSTVECLWERAASAKIEMPVNPTLLEVLRVAAEHTPADLAASGLLELVIKADGERKDRMRQAAAALKPFGDATSVLTAWVDQQITD
ncbi:MAG: hypothetical protein HY561_02310 [Gemmatimonadetes bacterium]|nr:hypothetical protein [Gemmatimonadota bacterium]